MVYLQSIKPSTKSNKYKISGRSIYRNGVIGVTFSPVVVARIGLQALAIENVVKGLSVLNAFCQVWVRDPA